VVNYGRALVGVRSVKQEIGIEPERVSVDLIASGRLVMITPFVFQRIAGILLEAVKGKVGRLYAVGVDNLVADVELVVVGNGYAGCSSVACAVLGIASRASFRP